MSAPLNPRTADVLRDWHAGVRPYALIAERHGLTKDAVCGLVRRAGLARKLQPRGPMVSCNRSTDWEARLTQPWRSRHA